MEQLALAASGVSSPTIPGIRADGASLALDVQLLKLVVTNAKFQRKPNQILLIGKMCGQLARALMFRLMQILGGEALPTQGRQRDLDKSMGIWKRPDAGKNIEGRMRKGR